MTWNEWGSELVNGKVVGHSNGDSKGVKQINTRTHVRKCLSKALRFFDAFICHSNFDRTVNPNTDVQKSVAVHHHVAVTFAVKRSLGHFQEVPSNVLAAGMAQSNDH